MYKMKMLSVVIASYMTLVVPGNAILNCQRWVEPPMIIEIEKPKCLGDIRNKVDSMAKFDSVEEVATKLSFDSSVKGTCGLSKENFVKLLKDLPYDYVGLYERNAETIWEMEQKYQVNAIFACGVFAIESGWGRYDACKNNYAGLGGDGGYMSFATEEEFIEYAFKYLKDNYISCGLDTVESIAYPYTRNSNTNWHYQVYSAMTMILLN